VQLSLYWRRILQAPYMQPNSLDCGHHPVCQFLKLPRCSHR
jgi:hypothetical protein